MLLTALSLFCSSVIGGRRSALPLRTKHKCSSVIRIFLPRLVSLSLSPSPSLTSPSDREGYRDFANAPLDGLLYAQYLVTVEEKERCVGLG